MKKTILIASLILSCAAASANGIAGLKALCPAGSSIVISSPTIVSGVVVSDCHSDNMALNPNISYAKVDLTENNRTAYLQEADGSIGMKLVFDEQGDNDLCRFDRVTFDLKGCTLKHEADPDRIVVTGVCNGNVTEYAHGTAEGVAVREKYVNELTDNDIYTFVTLKDLELIFKDGSYTDIYEGYAQPTKGYTYEGYYPNCRMDGWASLLRDTNGSTIYLLVNTKCTWRRNGRQLPQGIGPVSGIIDYCPMRRYGGNMGRYSIRPLDESGIAISKKKNSPWKTLTGWELDGSNGQSLEFETLGVQTGVFKDGKKGDRVVSDCGQTQGFFWTDSDSFIHIDNDLNSTDVSGRGVKINGVIMFKGASKGWFKFDENGKPVEIKSFFIEFDAKKAKGSSMLFSFSWLVGLPKIAYDYNYPGEWKVQMTLDEGRTWTTLKETATGSETIMLRSHPWWDDKIGGSKKYTGYDCGLGMQQRSFTIPAEAMGRSNVILRLCPASTKLSAIRSRPAKNVMDPAGEPSPKMKNNCWIRFGKVLIEYK